MIPKLIERQITPTHAAKTWTMITIWCQDIIVIITRGHDGVLVEAPEDVDVEDAEAQLDAGGEDLDQHGARGDDPAPAALGVIMLTESGGLGVETFQR